MGLKVILGVGAVVDMAHGWFDIFHDEQASFKERLAQLEEAAAISPREAGAIVDDYDILVSKFQSNLKLLLVPIHNC